MVTIKDIAERAGVSLGTVDRVLHNRGRFSDETAKKVRQIAQELGFTPNLFARNLSTSKRWVFGVLSPATEQDGGYWSQPLNGIIKAVEANKSLLIDLEIEYFDRYSGESFTKASQRLLGRKVDALILAPVLPGPANAIINEARSLSIACVSYDTELNHSGLLCQVGQDSYRSGRMLGSLVQMLIPKGGTIAILKPDTDSVHIGRRLQGIKDKLNLRIFEVYECAMPHRTEESTFLKALHEYISRAGRPDAIIVPDATTHLVAAVMMKLRLEVPLVGYDLLEADIPYIQNGMIHFLVTQNPQQQGELAVQALVDNLILGKPTQATVAMPVNIVTFENYTDFLNI